MEHAEAAGDNSELGVSAQPMRALALKSNVAGVVGLIVFGKYRIAGGGQRRRHAYNDPGRGDRNSLARDIRPQEHTSSRAGSSITGINI